MQEHINLKNNLSLQKKEKKQQLTSGLAKLGGKVLARISVRPLTVSDNPNGVQLYPQLRQAAGTLSEMRRKCGGITSVSQKRTKIVDN